jgi:hypothetical protein
LRKVLTGF